ncbi:hypothetical protein HDU87_006668 [Geranomyces variabilis]|uniref:Cytochrome P450 monooxygenase n=1 Tax=Geranomyces variabilis TaxID=109894 RepID=A0AAD5XQC8_9FUNG|nr:hypothetical protein HDU87_006668 [Geranomyces variabilis]
MDSYLLVTKLVNTVREMSFPVSAAAATAVALLLYHTNLLKSLIRGITRDYKNKYGDVYAVYNGTIRELVLTDPTAIKRYYANDGRVHRKAHAIGFGYYFGRLLGKAVGTMHNEDWFRVRRVVDPHFQMKVVKNMLPMMETDFRQWFEQLEKHAGAKHNGNAFEMDALTVAERTPVKVVARALFDPVLTKEDFETLIKMNEVHEKLVETAFLGHLPSYSWYRWLPTKANRMMDEYQEKWERLVLDMVARSRKENKPSPISEMYKSVEDGTMELIELLQTADEILYTNIDVTSTALAWGLIHLAQHPTAQAKARKEVFAAIENPEYGSTENERIAHYVALSGTYLHNCMLEAMRLVPLLYYSLPEVTAEAKEIGGYATSVLIDAYTLNRNAPCWAPDGDSYRPERFESLQGIDYRYSLWRFGIGPRKCVGQFFGDKIAKMFISSALRSFEYEIVGPITKKQNLFVQTPEATFRMTPIRRLAPASTSPRL